MRLARIVRAQHGRTVTGAQVPCSGARRETEVELLSEAECARASRVREACRDEEQLHSARRFLTRTRAHVSVARRSSRWYLLAGFGLSPACDLWRLQLVLDLGVSIRHLFPWKCTRWDSLEILRAAFSFAERRVLAVSKVRSHRKESEHTNF